MFAFDSVTDQLRAISPRRQGGRASFREADQRRAKWLSINAMRALVKAIKANRSNPRCGRLIRRDLRGTVTAVSIPFAYQRLLNPRISSSSGMKSTLRSPRRIRQMTVSSCDSANPFCRNSSCNFAHSANPTRSTMRSTSSVALTPSRVMSSVIKRAVVPPPPQTPTVREVRCPAP